MIPVATTGSPLRSRRGVVAVTAVAAAVIAVVSAGPTETLAEFADDVWAATTGAGLSAAKFGIEGSLDNSEFGDHPAIGSAAELQASSDPDTVAFASPISLFPGKTTYSRLYLRTTAASSAATVSMSAAQKQASPTSDTALWDTYVTYGVRAVPTTTSETCDASVFSQSKGSVMYPVASKLTLAAPATTFNLSTNGGSTTMLCFAFSLDTNVSAGAPSSNGESVYPYWTFTGQS